MSNTFKKENVSPKGFEKKTLRLSLLRGRLITTRGTPL